MPHPRYGVRLVPNGPVVGHARIVTRAGSSGIHRSAGRGQRSATVRALQDYTRLKARAAEGSTTQDLAWLLVLDSLVFAAEAEVRWLDHCEARLARAAADRPATAPLTAVPATDGRMARP